MKVKAVYTGDSTNFHIFQVTESAEVVGTLYIRKETSLFDKLEVELSTPARDKAGWEAGVNNLLDNVRGGSKAQSKLVKVLQAYDGPQHKEKK